MQIMPSNINRSLPVRSIGDYVDLGGENLCIASAIGFVKACLDIVESHESLLLGAKAILVARLALNGLPKVAP